MATLIKNVGAASFWKIQVFSGVTLLEMLDAEREVAA
jgi:hypothetical protein